MTGFEKEVKREDKNIIFSERVICFFHNRINDYFYCVLLTDSDHK
jgi:hypothetical protein